jgi:hypothetical protein
VSRILFFSKLSRASLGCTQPSFRQVPGALSPGVEGGKSVMLTTHPNCVPMSRNVALHPSEDGDRASLRNVVMYRKNQTMDIVHKHSSLVNLVPSSESFQAYFVLHAKLRNISMQIHLAKLLALFIYIPPCAYRSC